MSTIQRVAATLVGGIVSLFVGGAIVAILAKMAGVNSGYGARILVIVIGAMIVIWLRTGSRQDAVNVSSETPQEGSSNIVSAIEIVPVNQCPKFIFDAINKQRTPFARSLTQQFRGRTYLYTVTGVSPQLQTIAHVTRQRLR